MNVVEEVVVVVVVIVGVVVEAAAVAATSSSSRGSGRSSSSSRCRRGGGGGSSRSGCGSIVAVVAVVVVVVVVAAGGAGVGQVAGSRSPDSGHGGAGESGRAQWRHPGRSGPGPARQCAGKRELALEWVTPNLRMECLREWHLPPLYFARKAHNVTFEWPLNV